MDCRAHNSIHIKTERLEENDYRCDHLEKDGRNTESLDIPFIKVEACDVDVDVFHDSDQSNDTEECEMKYSYDPLFRPEVILDEEDPLCVTNESEGQVTSSSSRVEGRTDDPAVLQFWLEHDCCERCRETFTVDDLRTLRRESQALDYTDRGVNRLDLIVLSVIRVLWCRKYEQQNLRENNFRLFGVKVCRDFFLFAHAIRLHRWQSLLEMYKESGLLIKHFSKTHPVKRS